MKVKTEDVVGLLNLFPTIKSCTYWDSSASQALHEHACLFYEKCNADRVGKIVIIL